MKNLIKILILILLAVTLLITKEVKALEKVNVYLFWGDGCPHCERAKEFFKSMDVNISKKYNLIEYEVWYNKSNNTLMNKVAGKLGVQTSGVPLIVIGEKYFEGYSEKSNTNIINSIEDAYNSNNNIDIIKEVNTKKPKVNNILPSIMIWAIPFILIFIFAISIFTKQKKSK